MCSNCKNCALLLQIEEERTQWFKEITLKNIQLHKKLNEKEKLILILKNKLREKRSSFICDYIGDVTSDLKKLADHPTVKNNELLEKYIKNQFEEISEFITIFNNERETFQEEIESNERYFLNDITYLNGLVDYFRESLFEEMEKSNQLKRHFLQKLSQVTNTSHYIVLNTLKEEAEKLNDELKSRYKKTIIKSKEETQRQSLLVSKLRRHNKELYWQLYKLKSENERKVSDITKKCEDLKVTVKKLREKNDNLHKQIKLEVEGCQNDIFDIRRKIKTK